jgi:glycosyltransferase involved in cell wall biosynthesis
MTKIRILQIVTRLAVRGVPRHVIDLAAGLDPRRYEVEVLAGRSEPGEGELWTEARERGLRTWHLPALQRAVDPAADLAAFVALYRRIRAGRYDIVHTHISKAGILGRLAARCAGVPVVIHTYHGQVEELGGRTCRSRFFRYCERRAARWTDLIVANSHDTARQCLARGIGTLSQYQVIHNGIDLAPFLDYGAAGPLPGIEGGPLLGTVGSLTPEKGLAVLMQAAASWVGRYPRLRICMVGDGVLRVPLGELARRLELGDRVVFPGIQRDVRPWLAAFDLLLMPSLHEGMGIALLEAMAMGKPVVASRTGGIPEVVVDGQTGLLVPPGDPEALAAAVDRLLRDEAARRRLGQAGQERVKQCFALEGMVRQLEAAYERLLSRKGRGR